MPRFERDLSVYHHHKILGDGHLASRQPKKSQRRKWIRYERTYSNSMWHTDFKLLDDGRWFL